ncbi:MAG: hypothetical protein ABIH85_01040 [Candidatus Omnitrophota bacterium]|nr:hypothetical protein [Candidatus Omnitrophota bacterium]
MDSRRYEKYGMGMEKEFETRCSRCGECCGALDDPCRNLVKVESQAGWFCKVYDNRFGEQKTVSGKTFHCVSIREHIKNDTLRPNCAYRNGIK